ncbi:MAG: hypothetical protein J5845_05040 [Lachnospiraceae bacterium]|nr:hypothetical protein [Lachnospiraceae bacterium]
MDARIWIIVAVIAAAAIIYYKPFGSLNIVKKKCAATVTGKYVYSEGYYRANSPGTGVTYMVPVYEYTVDGMLYMTIVEGMQQSYNVFPLEVEVKYNPSEPEVCFIEGKRGKIIKKK